MAEFIVGVIIYTFSIYGMIIFIREMLNYYVMRDTDNKLVYIIENEENCKELIELIAKNSIEPKLYIVCRDIEKLDYIKEVCKEQDNCILITEEEIRTLVGL